MGWGSPSLPITLSLKLIGSHFSKCVSPSISLSLSLTFSLLAFVLKQLNNGVCSLKIQERIWWVKLQTGVHPGPVKRVGDVGHPWGCHRISHSHRDDWTSDEQPYPTMDVQKRISLSFSLSYCPGHYLLTSVSLFTVDSCGQGAQPLSGSHSFRISSLSVNSLQTISRTGQEMVAGPGILGNLTGPAFQQGKQLLNIKQILNSHADTWCLSQLFTFVSKLCSV